jgi:hypothetical protein
MAHGLARKVLHASTRDDRFDHRDRILTDRTSSVPTGSSTPKLESTTAPSVHQQAFPQIRHSPAMESHKPSNWPSTSSPPTQRSMPSTRAPSTVASRLSRPSPRLALPRTAKTPKSRKLSSTSKPVWGSSTALHDSTTPRPPLTTSWPNTSPTTLPRNRTPSSSPPQRARVSPNCTTASPTAWTPSSNVWTPTRLAHALC